MNRLVLILCSWLLNKTLVITTNLTNPESASEYINSRFTCGKSNLSWKTVNCQYIMTRTVEHVFVYYYHSED